MMEQATFCVGKSRVAKVPNLDLDQTKCVCHILPKETGELTAFSQTSWATLTNAAEIRQDFVWELLKSSQISSPRGFYHRRCYQLTHTRRLFSESKFSESKFNVRETLRLPTLILLPVIAIMIACLVALEDQQSLLQDHQD